MNRNYTNINARLNQLLSTSQNKSYFVAAITVVFIVIMALVGIVPAYSAFSFQNEENAIRDDLISKLNKKLETSKNLTSEYDSKINLVNYFDVAFPEQANQKNVIDTIDSIVKSNNGSLSKISFNANPSPTFVQAGYDLEVQSQSLSITVQGSQSGILNIVSDIENNRRILNILNLTIDRVAQEIIDQGGATAGEFVLNAQLEYYFYSNAVPTL